MTKCPACGHLWFHTPQGSGCLTKGCAHTLLRRDKTSTAKRKPKEKKQ